MGQLKIKRIYEPAETADGYRILVDRLWPRGVSRDQAALDLWLKDVAPSPELRTWWDHDPARLDEFSERYQAELSDNPAVAELEDARGRHDPVTLLYAAHDPEVNHARVLKSYLDEHPA
jgi:uncharacterized protein YeaO (DUF488 family)